MSTPPDVPGAAPVFWRELEAAVDLVYRSQPRLPDRRADYPWVTGYLGDPFAPVWFLAESPSLSRVEVAARSREARTPEMQWSISPGDKLFRRMLVKHGFKSGGEFDAGGWRCYITDVIKSTYRVKDWQATPEQARRAVAEAWAPVLSFELEQGRPRLLVVLGKKTLSPLEHLVRRRLIPPLPQMVTIFHYSYIGSRPDRQGRGPMDPQRVREWDASFGAIATAARQLAERS